MLFEVKSVLQRKIRLTETQWYHIHTRHPEINNQMNKIIKTLQIPDFVYYSKKEHTYHYLKFFETTPVSEKYLLVITKHLNEEGFVITCFFISKIKVREKVLIYVKNKNKL